MTTNLDTLALLLGGLTLLDAFDKSVLLVPYLPVSPAWLRGLLGVGWVVWAVVIVLSAEHKRRAPRPGKPEEPAPAGAPPG